MLFGTDNHERYGDPDDFFHDTRMSFGEHIEDLRAHLIRAIAGFVVILLLCFALDFVGFATGLPVGGGRPVLAFISRPVEEQLGEFYDRREETLKRQYLLTANEEDKLHQTEEGKLEVNLRDLVGKLREAGVAANPDQVSPDTYVTIRTRSTAFDDMKKFENLYKVLGPRPVLRTMNVQEAFVVYFKVCMVTGFVLGSPWIFYQVWAFIAAGLYPHERRYVNVYLPFSLCLFLLGVLICEFLVMPRAVEALLWFNEWLNLEPDLRLNEWLGFAMMMPVIFGLAFQTPLIMLFMERIGLGSVEGYRQKRRISWFAMAVAAAVFTPSTDPYSMLLLWVPMCLFYELGIWLCIMSPRDPNSDLDVPDPEEMVEV